MLRAGVAGLRRGRSHVRVLQAIGGVEVAAVADLDGDVVERICREYHIPRGCSSLAELLDQEIDFVVIATPLPLHGQHAIEALERGVHVLSEVTAARTRDECEALVEAVERSGKQYMMGENCCYWAFVETVKTLRERGTFGDIFYGEAEYIHDVQHLMHDAAGLPTWRAQRMEPIIYCTHSFGPLLWMTGEYPTEVICAGTGSHFVPGMTDLQTALVRLTNGGLVKVTISFTNARWPGHRYSVMGTRASFDTGWVNHDQPRFFTKDVPNLQGPVELPLGINVPGAPGAARDGGHGTAEWYMLRAFLESLRTGRRPPIDVYDAVMMTLPGICATESAAAGSTAIPVPQYQLRR
ncbi:MAG: Gfo/Idh/MocA family oxidoreductase [Chloroflexi bacterium]|nr:Gfo/Idh/MocA family oxidoreductase [Chloroflexota bacterium]